MMHVAPDLPAILESATCRLSDDPAKHDLELTCDECGEVICDVEDGDTIGILGSVVTDHQWTAHGWRGE